jgi:hypothetical protein
MLDATGCGATSTAGAGLVADAAQRRMRKWKSGEAAPAIPAYQPVIAGVLKAAIGIPEQ